MMRIMSRLIALLIVAAAAAVPLVPRLASASGVAVTGSTQQITFNPAGQFNSAISGNIVTYTTLQNGGPDVYYHDLSAGTDTQVTKSIAGNDAYELADVSGSTIVYVHFGVGTGNGDVLGSNVGGPPLNFFPIAVDPTRESTNPGISGSLVAWQDRGIGTFDIYARDLAIGVTKQITSNAAANSYSPNVSGREIAYSTAASSTSCQVFVTNFDTLVTQQLTNTQGCNQSVDVSGTRVVYAADRTGSGSPHTYLFDLTTSSETDITGTLSYTRNPHIDGDWVSFELVDQTANTSSIMLYYIPSGDTFTAVPGISSTSSAFLNDISTSGTSGRITFTGNQSGVDQVYVYSFVSTVADAPLTITHIAAAAHHLDAAAGVTFKDADPQGNLAQYSGTINWGDGMTSAASFTKVPTFLGGGFAAGGLHDYSVPGTYIVTITINDVGGATASASKTLTVKP